MTEHMIHVTHDAGITRLYLDGDLKSEINGPGTIEIGPSGHPLAVFPRPLTEQERDAHRRALGGEPS